MIDTTGPNRREIRCSEAARQGGKNIGNAEILSACFKAGIKNHAWISGVLND
jgi:hypothetical protein